MKRFKQSKSNIDGIIDISVQDGNLKATVEASARTVSKVFMRVSS